MNEKKFCFISCVNNKLYYDECLYYINRLKVPEGYTIEIISIEDSKSMTEGYNRAMKQSDAKYKIYLHQDTFIINQNFLYDILFVFENNKDIGMIGVAGSKVVPTSGIWWESKHKYGKVYDSALGCLRKQKYMDFNNRYEEVKMIAGFIMITQYDVGWRSDIFDGYDFYDTSQSIEFIKKGYKVAIPSQDIPWIIHDCGMAKIGYYNKYRKKFIDEYYKDMFPLVSILIPTYNRPEYFKLALESAINQTYKNIEIIIGDDSTDDNTEKLVDEYISKYDNIKYYHNENNLGQYDNDLKLMELAKGRYINFLMDDDLFEPNKIEKMMKEFIEDGSLSLVSSNRKFIDYKGNYKGNFIKESLAEDICNKIIEGKILIEFIVSTNNNILGEPTTVLFDKTKMKEQFGSYHDRKFICNVDQASWFDLLENGKGIILSDTLSSFRIHDNQQLSDIKNIIGGVKDYSYMIFISRKNKLFSNDKLYFNAVKNCYKYSEYISKKIKNEEVNSIVIKLKHEMDKVKKVLIDNFTII